MTWIFLTSADDAADIVGSIGKELVIHVRFPQAGHGIIFDTPEPYFEAIREFVTSTS